MDDWVGGFVFIDRGYGMIDYEKLKMAHELARRYKPANRLKLIFIYTNNNEIYYHLSIEPASSNFEYACLDDLIEKLRELVDERPDQKHEIGSKWWALGRAGRPFEVEIIAKMGGDVEILYPDGSTRYEVIKELYASREELIDSQIEYLAGLKKEEIAAQISKECQHETEKLYKYSEYCVNPPVFECNKCGELYR